MAQLPRCVQQASWKRVSGVCWKKVGGGPSMSMRGGSRMMMTEKGSLTRFPPATGRSFGSQSLLILCRPSSHQVSSSVNFDVSSSSSSSPASCDRLRFNRAGLGNGGVPNSLVDAVSLSRNSRLQNLSSLSSFLVRAFSSAEASAVTADGFLKDSLAKEVEEKSSVSLSSVEERADSPFSEVDSEIERNALVAEIDSKERELEELRRALRQVEGKQCVIVEKLFVTESVSLDMAQSSSSEDSGSDFSNAPIRSLSPLVQEIDLDLSSESDEESSNDETFDLASSHILEDQELTTADKSVDSDAIPHPWPEWTQFLQKLNDGGYFENEEGTQVNLNGSSNEDLGLIKRACLNFARERDDIFLNYPRKDLEVLARFGCPCTDRKVVNAGKRLRDYLAIDEISVCKPCALRSSCERADFKASADHVAGTPEVIRLISQYAIEVSPIAEENLKVSSAVQKSCMNLLKETMALATAPRDPKLPKVERKAVMVKSDRKERESKRRLRDGDVQMKPGDWKCSECEYTNFARNRVCRECEAFRPAPDMRPGDWRCPECNFINFSRNQECHDCQVQKPAGLGSDLFDRGSRYDRGAPQERGSRFDRGSSRDRRSEVDSFERGSERGSYRRSETVEYERGSGRSESRGGERGSYGRSREQGGLEPRSGGDDDRGGRSWFEEWKPDLSKRESQEARDRKAALDILSDDEEFDLDDDDDDEDISDVEAFNDDEFEDMRPAPSAVRGRGGAARGREDRRSVDKDPWDEDKPFRGAIRDENRPFRGASRDEDRPFRGASRDSGRGGGRGGRVDFGRGDFERDSRGSSRDSRSPYKQSDRDSGRSYERSDRDFGRSYGNSDRDSGRSFERSGRDSGRPSRGRGGARGGGGGRGGVRGRGGRGR